MRNRGPVAFGPNLAEFLHGDRASNRPKGVTLRMRVALEVLAPVGEPHVQVQDEYVLGVMLRPGFIDPGYLLDFRTAARAGSACLPKHFYTAVPIHSRFTKI